MNGVCSVAGEDRFETSSFESLPLAPERAIHGLHGPIPHNRHELSELTVGILLVGATVAGAESYNVLDLSNARFAYRQRNRKIWNGGRCSTCFAKVIVRSISALKSCFQFIIGRPSIHNFIRWVARRQDSRPLFEAFEPEHLCVNFYLDAKKAAGRLFRYCRESRCQVQEFCTTCFPGAPISPPENR